MNSPGRSDAQPIDLHRDVPVTAADIDVLRRLRRETPSWLSLTAAEIDALIPEQALERRAATPADAQPFVLD